MMQHTAQLYVNLQGELWLILVCFTLWLCVSMKKTVCIAAWYTTSLSVDWKQGFHIFSKSECPLEMSRTWDYLWKSGKWHVAYRMEMMYGLSRLNPELSLKKTSFIPISGNFGRNECRIWKQWQSWILTVVWWFVGSIHCIGQPISLLQLVRWTSRFHQWHIIQKH